MLPIAINVVTCDAPIHLEFAALPMQTGVVGLLVEMPLKEPINEDFDENVAVVFS